MLTHTVCTAVQRDAATAARPTLALHSQLCLLFPIRSTTLIHADLGVDIPPEGPYVRACFKPGGILLTPEAPAWDGAPPRTFVQAFPASSPIIAFEPVGSCCLQFCGQITGKRRLIYSSSLKPQLLMSLTPTPPSSKLNHRAGIIHSNPIFSLI